MAANPPWTRDDDKRFESALLDFNGNLVMIAQHLQKPLVVVQGYYDALIHDIELIESGKYALPKYPEDDYVSDTEAGKSKYKDNERKRGIPWSQEEHGLFLDGLKKFGKGDWKSIARHCVKSRTATQVASHAQKFFLRQKSEAKTRKRSSIHDITMGDDDNVTVPGSNLQPQFGDQIPPDYYHS
ncbi:Transcription factor SRM1 [Cardamine amara subsp. amara]|uniref:Transcription factor SRM1 n=1 Tax=Cardamine amara subsp. amara TaxID=228776 RepID=A0ABD0YZI3_CARAN